MDDKIDIEQLTHGIAAKAVKEMFKDKIEPNKGLEGYLNDRTKNDLATLYHIFSILENNEKLDKKANSSSIRKAELVEIVKDNMIKNLHITLDVVTENILTDLKKIANSKDDFFDPEGKVRMAALGFGKSIGILYGKAEKDNFQINMPIEFKEIIKKYKAGDDARKYQEIFKTIDGILNTYGVCPYGKLMEIVLKLHDIDRETLIFVLMIAVSFHLQSFQYSPELSVFYLGILDESDVKRIHTNVENYIEYDLKFYKDMYDYNYVLKSKEYKALNNYLKKIYDFDLNNDKELRKYLLFRYLEGVQVNKMAADICLENNFNNGFEHNSNLEFVNFKFLAEDIVKIMPIWMKGGYINEIEEEQTTLIDNKTKNLGRNDKCWCGSGLKFKHCHGK